MANAQDEPNPKKAEIPKDGSVEFNASRACWLYFSPTGVFGNANGLLKLDAGPSEPYYPHEQNAIVSYCVTDSTCTPLALNVTAKADRVLTGNTIKVG
jgi:hypothetical protein